MHQLISRDGGATGLLTPWEKAGFHVAAELRAANGQDGGDFYTLAVRAPGHIGVVIGDACGRGAEGDEQLCKILPQIHQLALSGASPAALLAALNQTVLEELPSDRFVTAAAFEFDMRAGTLTLANAAHVPAILRRARGGKVSVIGRASGVPLGVAAHTRYAEERYELNGGDLVVLMTDGVLEAVESDLLTMCTLKALLSQSSGGATSVQHLLLQTLETHLVGRRPDDMTLMALEALCDPIASTFLDFARPS